jgi:hypothetical protein
VITLLNNLGGGTGLLSLPAIIVRQWKVSIGAEPINIYSLIIQRSGNS